MNRLEDAIVGSMTAVATGFICYQVGIFNLEQGIFFAFGGAMIAWATFFLGGK